MESPLLAVHDLSIFHPASPQASSIRDLSLLVFAITGFIFVVVEGILFYCIYRFRSRANSSGTEPPQFYGSKPIEIAWTVAPALIVFTIVLVTTRTLWEVEVDPPAPAAGDNALFITLVGRQWWWECQYDHFNGQTLGFVTANEIHVPVSEADRGRPVHLTLKSADVCHSFWVPRLGGKTDLIPGRVNHALFQTEEAGLFVGQCAEYCGTQHANMLLRVVVESPEQFARWAENQQTPAREVATAEKGKGAFLALSCINCHRVRGTSAKGTYAPDLTHLMSRDTLAGGMLPNTPENLRRWIDAPQEIKPGCLMPGFGLSPRAGEQVTQYLLTLE